MKHFLLSLLLVSSLLGGMLAHPQPVSAQYDTELQRQLESVAGEKGAGYQAPEDPRAVAARLIGYVLGLLGIMVISYTVYGGYLIMTSAGNEEQVATGKKTLRNGVIGVIIITSAYSITQFAVRLASGDRAHDGNFIEIERQQNPNRDPLNRGITPDAFSPLPQQADGNFRATF